MRSVTVTWLLPVVSISVAAVVKSVLESLTVRVCPEFRVIGADI